MALDPRVNFVCIDFPEIVEHIEVFTGNSQAELSEALRKFTCDVIDTKANIDLIVGDLNFPKVLNKYKEDFGGSDETVIRFVYKHLIQPPPIPIEKAIKSVCLKRHMIINYK